MNSFEAWHCKGILTYIEDTITKQFNNSPLSGIFFLSDKFLTQ